MGSVYINDTFKSVSTEIKISNPSCVDGGTGKSVPHGPAEFLVRHAAVIFLLAP